MKRFLAILVVLSVLLAFFSPALADSNLFEAPFTNSVLSDMGETASSVISDGFMRAAVSVLLLYDLDDSGLYGNTWWSDAALVNSYVGISDDGMLTVLMQYKETGMLMIVYLPGVIAALDTTDFGSDITSSFDDLAPAFFEMVGISRYYKNTATDLLSVLEILQQNL